MKWFLNILITLVMLTSHVLFAEAFYLSGRMVKADGKPVSGETSIKVELCLTTSCSSPTYTSTMYNVKVKNGVFQVSLTLSSSEFSTAFPGPATTTYYRITDMTNSPNAPFEAQAIAVLPYAYRIPIDTTQFKWDTSGQLALVNGAGGSSSSGSQVVAASSSAASSALIVSGASGQTANIADFRNSSGSTLFAIDPSGIAKFLGPGTSYFMGMKAATGMTGNVTYTFPAAPVAGGFLQTDASGNLSWANTGGSTAASSVTGLTTGSIAFASATGLTESNAQLFWDNTNNRLGVGTNAPATSLHVSGDLRLQNIRTYGMTRTIPTTVNDYINLGSLAFTSGGANLTVKVSASGFSASKTYFIALSDDQTSGGWKKVAPLVDSYASGDDFALDINVSTTTATLRLRRTGGTTAGTAYVAIYHEGNLGDAFTASSTTGSVAAPAGYLNTSLLTMNPAGIQTYGKLFLAADPASALEAATKQYVDNAFSAGAVSGTTTIATSGNISTTGTLGIGTTSPGSKVEIKGTGTSSATSSLNVTNSVGSSKFFVRDDGFVGIGTTSPDAPLKIFSGVTNVGTKLDDRGIYFSRASDGTYTQSIASDTAATLTYSARNAHTFNVNSSQAFGIYSNNGSVPYVRAGAGAAGSALSTFSVNGNAAIGSTSTYYNASAPAGGLLVEGNVGIGTTSPTYGLHIAPSSGVTAAQTVFVQDATPTTGNTKVTIKAGAANSGSAYLLDIQNAAGGNLFNFRTDGVFGTSSAALIGSYVASGSGSFRSSWTTTARTLSLVGGDSVGSWAPTTGTNSFVNITNTFNPSSGSAAAIGLDISPTINQTGTATGDYTALRVNATETSATGANKRLLDLQTGGTSKLVVTSAGAVGIGTTNPVGIMDVSGGNVYLRELGTADSTNLNYDSGKLYFRGSAWVSGAAVNQDTYIFNDAYQSSNGQALNFSVAGTSPLVLYNNELRIGATANIRSASSTLSMKGRVADGASAVGTILGNDYALSTSGAKLLSIQNTTTEKAYFDKDGNLGFTGSATISTPSNSGILTLSGGSSGGATSAIIFSRASTQLMDVNGSGSANYSVKVNAVGSSSVKALVVKGAGSNTAPLQEWQDSSGNALSVVNYQGYVGIGTTSPSYKLDVSGDTQIAGSSQTCVIGAGAGVNCTSDQRLKENISPIKNALAKILSIRGVEFDWNNKARAPGKHQIGVIAQEIQKTFPESVEKLKGEEGYLTVDYASLVAPLIEAVREIWGHVSEVIAQLNHHAEEIETLKAQVQEKDRRIDQLETYLCAKDPSAAFCAQEGKAH